MNAKLLLDDSRCLLLLACYTFSEVKIDKTVYFSKSHYECKHAH